MAKQMTAKQLENHEQKIIAQSNIWLQKYSPEQVSALIWRKFGYLTEVKNGVVYIQGHKGRREVVCNH